MTDKQEAIRSELYDQWLKHPVTAMLLQSLKKDRDFFVEKIALHAVDSEVSDLRFRYYGFGVKNINNVISMITDYAKFTKYTQ